MEGGSKILNVLFTTREGPEYYQARSMCSIIIWFIVWINKGMLLIGSQPVWERSSQARVQLPNTPLPHMLLVIRKGRRLSTPRCVAHREDPIY